MPQIEVVLAPSLLRSEFLTGSVAVVIDVLRATSTIAIALSQGASGIVPVSTPEHAFKERDQSNIPFLIGGERMGKPLDGFDFGNSPREYTRRRVEKRQILLTTTNGTQALLASSAATEIWIGSFLNRWACCEVLADRERIFFVCAGKEGRFCLEDAVCAGAMVEGFRELGSVSCSDAALAAESLYAAWRGNLMAMLHQCEHGRYLASIGLGEDLNLCARLDSLDVNGRLTGKVIGRIETDPPATEVGRSLA